MKKNVLVLLLLIFGSFNGVSADQVSCEKIESEHWFTGLGSIKTCCMEETTEINSVDTTIASRDKSVLGLGFWNNKKIKFLPIAISENFPNLRGLGAFDCSLTTISKTNFKGLSKLRYLSLGSNQIEKIPSDVFDELVELEQLYLYKNKLKFINGKAFARLTRLTHVWLNSNQCINEKFVGELRIAVLQKTVDEKCSFEELEIGSIETSTMTTSTVSSSADKKCDKSQDLTTLTTTIEGMKAETSEKLKELKAQQKEECGSIAKALEAQTKAFEAQANSHAKALKDQQTYFNEALEAQAKTCNQQQTYFNEVLANKTAEIIDVKVKSELQKMLKMTEIQRLEEELQRKNAEIIENRQKIKTLEQKNAD